MLERKEVEKLRWAFANNECMTQLDLSFSALRNFDADFPLLADALGKHPSLSLLDLTCSGAGMKGLKACEEVVRSNLSIIEVFGLGLDPSDAPLSPIGDDERESRLSLGPQSLSHSINQPVSPSSRKQSPKGQASFIRPSASRDGLSVKRGRVRENALSLFIFENASLKEFQAFSPEPSIAPHPFLVVSLTNRDLPGFPAVLFNRNLLYLRTLNLSKNGLESLPPVIGAMENLETLILNRNKLRSLPGTIGELKQLKILDVSSNQLTSLPPTFRLLSSVEILDLSSNFFSELPYYLRRFPRLERFHFKNNPLRLKGAERDGNSAEALRQMGGGEFCHPKRSKIVMFGSGGDLEALREIFKDGIPTAAMVPLFKKKPSILLGEGGFKRRQTLTSSSMNLSLSPPSRTRSRSPNTASQGMVSNHSERFVSPPPGIGSSPSAVPSFFSSSTPGVGVTFDPHSSSSKSPRSQRLSSKNFSEEEEGDDVILGGDRVDQHVRKVVVGDIVEKDPSPFVSPLSLSPALTPNQSPSSCLPPSSLFAESPQSPPSPGISSQSSPFPVSSSSSSLSSVPSSPLPPRHSPSPSPPSPCFLSSPSLSPKSKTFLTIEPPSFALASTSSSSSSAPSSTAPSPSFTASPSFPLPSLSQPPTFPLPSSIPSPSKPEEKQTSTASFPFVLPPLPDSLFQCPNTPPPVPLHDPGSELRDSNDHISPLSTPQIEEGKGKEKEAEEDTGKGKEREESLTTRGRAYTDSPKHKNSLRSPHSAKSTPSRGKISGGGGFQTNSEGGNLSQRQNNIQNISPRSFKKMFNGGGGGSRGSGASPLASSGSPSSSLIESPLCSPFTPSSLAQELQLSGEGELGRGKEDLRIFVEQFQVGRKRDRQMLTVTALGVTGEGKEVVRCAPMIVSDYSTCVVCVRLEGDGTDFSIGLETEKLVFLLGERYRVLLVLLGEDDQALGVGMEKAQGCLYRDSKVVCAILPVNLMTSLLLFFWCFWF